jgi:peptidoglycan/LPS O-acetylase OafA/YrhL
MSLIQKNRDRNLDLIRAVAIVMVLIDHGVGMSPIGSTWIGQVTGYGQYGVDLFFVLSGWLIGGLYWRERKKFGNVLIGRFWVRRWVRTIPPYLVALLFSYLAVYIARHEPLDYGYLSFFQNYYERIPFFLVSWSLCVEEHFYLLVPLAFLIWRGVGDYRLTIALLLSILIVPPICRFIQYPGSAIMYSEMDGFSQTATHLRMEGLILGFMLSFIATEAPRDFQAIALKASYVIFISALSLPPLLLAGGRVHYTLWTTMVSLLFAAILVFAVSRSEITSAFARVVHPVALASYSIYLIHPLSLHVAQIVSKDSGTALYFLLATALVAASGAIFFLAIERTSIAVRDLRWPRRTAHSPGGLGVVPDMIHSVDRMPRSSI